MANLSDEALRALAGFAQSGRIGDAVPVIRELYVPDTAFAGHSVTVSWDVYGAEHVVLTLTGPRTHRAVPVTESGNYPFSDLPLGVFRLELTASFQGAATKRSVEFAVAEAPPVLDSSLSSAVCDLSGEVLRLNWRAGQAETVTVEYEGHTTRFGPAGEMAVKPSRTGRHTIQLVAAGPGGQVRARHAFVATAPKVEIALDVPRSAPRGEPVSVTWNTRGVKTVELTVNDRLFADVPGNGTLVIDACDREYRLRLSVVGHDGRRHERSVRVAPELLKTIRAPVQLCNVIGPTVLANIR